MWLDGSPLAYTIFSCLYIHKPTAVVDDLYLSPLIALFLKQSISMRSVIETTGEVWQLVQDSSLNFQEDEFFRSSYGFEFSDREEAEVLQLYSKAEEDLLGRLKGTSGMFGLSWGSDTL